MATMRAVLLDVFTDEPLTGNQLAVFLDGAEVPPALRQDVAREVGFSETVFVDPPSHPTAGDVAVHIFTPEAELPFAGHPVLGTAVAVAADRALDGGSVVTLECGIGPVPVELDGDGKGGWMRQPRPTVERWQEDYALIEALGLPGGAVVAPVELYDNGPRHLVVAVRDETIVRSLQPDTGAIARLAGSIGVSVCSTTGPDTVVTRMFMPGAGIVEDPATGSAAGPIGVHLLRHGLVEPGRELTLSQGREINRPSILKVRVEGLADAIAAVGVGGAAVIVGELTFVF